MKNNLMFNYFNFNILTFQISNKSLFISKRILFLSSIYFFTIQFSVSQITDFSYPYSDKIYLNPAFAGSNICPEISMNYKKQFANDFYGISYNQYFDKIHGGLALLILNDSQAKGMINNIFAGIIYSYHLKFRKKRKINFAFQFNYIQQNINTDDLIFNDMINPFSQIISDNTQENILFLPEKRIDFSTAYVFISEYYCFGTAFQHLNNIFIKSNNKFAPFKFTIHGSRIFVINNARKKENQIRLISQILYRRQSYFDYFNYGFYIKKNNLLASIFIKHDLKFRAFTPIFSVGFINKNIKFTYTYDTIFSKYYSLPAGVHQVSLYFKISCSKKRKNKSTIYCKEK